MQSDSDETDPDELRRRIAALEETVQAQQSTLEKMLPDRRQVLTRAAALGGLAIGGVGGAAAADTSDGRVGANVIQTENLNDQNDNTVLSMNGDGSVASISAEEASATNETYIKATRSSDSSSFSANTWHNSFDSESADVRGEFNTAQEFIPDKSGLYLINCGIEFDGSSTSGDTIQNAVYDVTNGTNISNRAKNLSTPGLPIDFTHIVNLTAGDKYTIRSKNKDSSFVLGQITSGNIIRTVVQA
jgi:hypothetical protein